MTRRWGIVGLLSGLLGAGAGLAQEGSFEGGWRYVGTGSHPLARVRVERVGTGYWMRAYAKSGTKTIDLGKKPARKQPFLVIPPGEPDSIAASFLGPEGNYLVLLKPYQEDFLAVEVHLTKARGSSPPLKHFVTGPFKRMSPQQVIEVNQDGIQVPKPAGLASPGREGTSR